jgi:hypothetical protein
VASAKAGNGMITVTIGPEHYEIPDVLLTGDRSSLLPR